MIPPPRCLDPALPSLPSPRLAKAKRQHKTPAPYQGGLIALCDLRASSDDPVETVSHHREFAPCYRGSEWRKRAALI
ncbi:hypothetical protein SBA1_800004 [Candidatus Sulfotelmatobacter kueseliae]|uniref:Uncharacterized protein n=1 Tax=Candidatus Sulfotelmatobacter kueseliae TaxID=2042962 RepID=A0A2U3L8D6_9BACT|nr:hypothetical protein SBA1_800004 [Candidatus Sulfotelmatobacter kueseliae]